jgi:membrane protein YdbS with pleckstrin-like domain
MNPEQTPVNDYDKPVAYDPNGQPLYAHPPVLQNQSDNQTQAVHLIRPTEPEKQIISDATRQKHDQSKKAYPNINLSEGEYVISSIRRHLIGLVLPISLGILLIALAITLMFNFGSIIQAFKFTGISIKSSIIILPVLVFICLVLLGMYVSYYVYKNNVLFLTNESIIQEIQSGMFSRRERIVSLMDIEDVSYTQDGLIQQMFNYGSIRLSTEGEGTIYYFKYVFNPKKIIAILSNAVEAFKNGRAIEN